MNTITSISRAACPKTTAGCSRTAYHTRLLPLLLLLTLPALVQAQDYTYTTNNGSITITGYTGPGGDVDIPDTIAGLPVTTIDGNWDPVGQSYKWHGAFEGCSSLTGITIPNSVSSIGNQAFSSCTNLTSVTIPDTVTNIGVFAFGGCTSLTNATIGYSVTYIPFGAFAGCSSLIDVIIPDSVTSIEDAAFNGCTGLTSVTIPDSVTTISDGMLGCGAFGGCSSLTNITFGSGVTNIGLLVVNSCTHLIAIDVNTANLTYSSVDGVLFSKDKTRIILCPPGRTGSYSIPDGVTTVGDYTFYCGVLTALTLPNTITSIGFAAFVDCERLTSVYFKGNAPSLGSNVFDYDNNATVYYLPGTTGWANFSANTGLSTALWLLPNPLILTIGPSFCVKTNWFGFIISWTTNIPVIVEASTTLANPTWSPISTNTLIGGSSYFSDPQWTNYPARFYRLRSR